MQGRRTGAMGQRLLAVFAHPDDEGQIAGIMARYVSQGAEAFLACATRGEMGMPNDSSLLGGRAMAQLREAELRCACKVLGVKNIRFLNYQEGSFHTADPDQVIGKVTEIIREFGPQIIITFGPEGVYGHRDHIAISRWVTSAFYATQQRNLSQGLQFPRRLYYTAYPRSLFDRLRSQGIEFRIELDGTIHSISGVPNEKITTVIDVSDYQIQKVASFQCHRSQLQRGDFRCSIMEGKLMELLATERLVRAFPPLPKSAGIEGDLFD